MNHPLKKAVKKCVLALACLLAVLVAGGCVQRKEVLTIYTWADYMAEDTIPKFEEKFGVKVVVDIFDSNESMFAKLKAGATGYDVIFPSSYMARIMNQQGMLLPLDHSKLPNLKHIDREVLAHTGVDHEMAYSVPYMVGTTGIGYLSDKITDLEESWGIFDRADLKGRMSLMNDMRETLGAALKFLGYSLNTTDETQITEAAEVVLRWKQNIAKFENEAYKPALASGEFLVAHGYNGDMLQLVEENEAIRYFMPREGGSVYSDDMVIPKTARNVELAHEFINFLHEPEVAAANINYVHYLCPNTAAYAMVDEEVRNDATVFLSADVLAKCEVIRDLGQDNAKYTKAWDRIKSGQ